MKTMDIAINEPQDEHLREIQGILKVVPISLLPDPWPTKDGRKFNRIILTSLPREEIPNFNLLVDPISQLYKRGWIRDNQLYPIYLGSDEDMNLVAVTYLFDPDIIPWCGIDIEVFRFFVVGFGNVLFLSPDIPSPIQIDMKEKVKKKKILRLEDL